jgi:drug/metabolite transporter (DMT)-like permease
LHVNAAVVGLSLSAAVLHAIWNALLRSGGDRLWSITVMSFAATAAAVPAALLLPAPSPGCWSYIAISAVLQVAYSIFLAYAYRHGELGQVYPVIRGSVPLLVTLGGFLLASQGLSGAGLLGVFMVSAGITSLAFGKDRISTKGLLLASATALCVACYVVADGIGVRLAGNAQSYTAWIFLTYGALLPMASLLLRGQSTVDVRQGDTVKAMAGGVLSIVSYGATIAALSLGKLGPVSALRETSVVFSVLLGRLLLGEPLTRRRLVTCTVVAIGAACIGYQA